MSELLLYETQILLEAGQFADALQHLQRHDLEIVDRLAVQEFKGALYVIVATICIVSCL